MNDALVMQLDAQTCRLFLPLMTETTTHEPISSLNPKINESLYIDLPLSFYTVWNTVLTREADLFEALQHLLPFLCQFIAEKQSVVDVNHKDERFDLVTDMDKGIEYLLRYWIKKSFPDHHIIGEEFQKDCLTSTGYQWYIDPIDGTSNYVNGKKTYCMNVVCLYQGAPFLTCIGFPAEQKLYSAKDVAPHPSSMIKSGLCSEFYPSRLEEKALFEHISSQLNYPIYSTHALGVSLIDLYLGQCDVFYKANVKLWDVMAAAALLYFHQHDLWDIELMTYDGEIFSIFSHDDTFISYLNQRHQLDCRVGLITITKKSDFAIKQLIRTCVYG